MAGQFDQGCRQLCCVAVQLRLRCTVEDRVERGIVVGIDELDAGQGPRRWIGIQGPVRGQYADEGLSPGNAEGVDRVWIEVVCAVDDLVGGQSRGKCP